jgi:sugar diacid utilization regulator
MLRLTELSQQLRRRVDPGHLVEGSRADALVYVLAVEPSFDLGSFVRRLADLAEDAAGEPAAYGVAVGGGGAVRRLVDVGLAVEQARSACRVAERVPHHRPVAHWHDLGSLGPMAALGDDALATLCEPEPLRRLVEADREGVLLQTLRTYLDHACDARAAAKRLFLHRGSLYHRLRRIEALGGIDLRDADQRLLIHMALRARLLLGHDPPTSELPRALAV